MKWEGKSLLSVGQSRRVQTRNYGAVEARSPVIEAQTRFYDLKTAERKSLASTRKHSSLAPNSPG